MGIITHIAFHVKYLTLVWESHSFDASMQRFMHLFFVKYIVTKYQVSQEIYEPDMQFLDAYVLC